jgi:hypothetical protein
MMKLCGLDSEGRSRQEPGGDQRIAREWWEQTGFRSRSAVALPLRKICIGKTMERVKGIEPKA